MRKEIVLPPHLYDRIKASAGEHGGVGEGGMFKRGEPWCAHGHAWGTETRYVERTCTYDEPELSLYLSSDANDSAMWDAGIAGVRDRISFSRWCKLLNVKRGVEAPKEVLV